MKITDVKTIILRVPISKPITDAYFSHKARNHVFVQIFTDEGIYGLGESSQYFAVSALPPLIDEGFKPYLIGKDPAEIAEIWDSLYKASFLYGRKGSAIIALSGVEIALWDIIGKKKGLPLYKLLGDRKVDKVRSYASGGFLKSNEELVQEMESFVEKGFKTVKMKVGFGKDRDIERVMMVRKSIGSEIGLIIDANMSYSVTEAVKVAKALKNEQLTWFEEPVSADDIEGMAYIKSHSGLSIAAGENEYTEFGFSDLIEKDTVHIVQPDVTRCGGISQAKKIGLMADHRGMKFAPHIFGSIVGLVAAAHLISCLPNGFLLEFDQTQNPLREELIETRFDFRGNFCMHVPDTPGVGVDLPPEIIRKYQG
jgi:L-alanine-DL-glutamate epimerase-like enolase superfamily enzyme